MKSYRDLEIYKESKRLVIEIHKIKINKFIQWVEGNRNEFPGKETGNQ